MTIQKKNPYRIDQVHFLSKKQNYFCGKNDFDFFDIFDTIKPGSMSDDLKFQISKICQILKVRCFSVYGLCKKTNIQFGKTVKRLVTLVLGKP